MMYKMASVCCTNITLFVEEDADELSSTDVKFVMYCRWFITIEAEYNGGSNHVVFMNSTN